MLNIDHDSAVLATLDAHCIEIWKTAKGWFWARASDLKASVPTMSDTVTRSPAVGPFGRRSDAAADAYAKLEVCTA